MNLLMLLIGLSTVLLAGCIAPGEVNREVHETRVPIGDILENPAIYNGTPVLVSGKVVQECGAGCWFFLDDGSGTIYVDLLPNNFAIPPIVGSKVTVEGTVLVEGRDVSILGRSVITDLKVYS